jgi:hypothetical protein
MPEVKGADELAAAISFGASSRLRAEAEPDANPLTDCREPCDRKRAPGAPERYEEFSFCLIDHNFKAYNDLQLREGSELIKWLEQHLIKNIRIPRFSDISGDDM